MGLCVAICLLFVVLMTKGEKWCVRGVFCVCVEISSLGFLAVGWF